MIEEEERQRVRAEVLQELATDDERALEVDRAKRALTIFYAGLGLAGLLVLSLGIPVLGCLAGVGVRLFFWASGLR